MSRGFIDNSCDKFRRENNIRGFFRYVNIEIDARDKAKCPFHGKKGGLPERTPSMIVNSESCFCFACGKTWYLDTLIQDYFDPAVPSFCKAEKKDHRLTLDGVKMWWNEIKITLPDLPNGKARKRGEYKGPVHKELVEYWHNQLKPEHREALYKVRLLTDETIDRLWIGWNPEHNSYSLPFWSGEPGKSEIDIVQFRKTDKSPAWITQKFYGLSGHNRPSLMGLHSIVGRDWCIMLFGTFDAILACQDGFPAVTPNGASTFSTKKHKERLNEYLKDIKKLYVVMDATESERESAQKTVDNITVVPEIHVSQFPENLKDYGDYRHEKSVTDFMVELLGWKLW